MEVVSSESPSSSSLLLDDNGVCPICLCTFEDADRFLMPCRHWTCAVCMGNLLGCGHPSANKCPVCRGPVMEPTMPGVQETVVATGAADEYYYEDEYEYDDGEDDWHYHSTETDEYEDENEEGGLRDDFSVHDAVASNFTTLPLPSLVQRRTLFANYGWFTRDDAKHIVSFNHFWGGDGMSVIHISPLDGFSWSDVYAQLGIPNAHKHQVTGKTLVLRGMDDEDADGFYVITSVGDFGATTLTARRKVLPRFAMESSLDGNVQIDIFIMRGPFRGVHHWT